jgi:hypothetical protein
LKKFLVVLCLALVPALASADSMDKYVEMMRNDVRTAKVRIITEALEMSSAQSDKFWPIQRQYETELAKLQDERIAMIKQYAADYESMNDAKATALMNHAMKLQDQRNALLKKYAGKVSKGVSPIIAARYVQVESFVQSLVDVQVRAEVPLIP